MFHIPVVRHAFNMIHKNVANTLEPHVKTIDKH